MTDRDGSDPVRRSRERLSRLIADRRSGRREPEASAPDSGRKPSREAQAFVEGLDMSELARREAGMGLAELVQTGRYDGLIPDEPPDEVAPTPEPEPAAELEATAGLEPTAQLEATADVEAAVDLASTTTDVEAAVDLEATAGLEPPAETEIQPTMDLESAPAEREPQAEQSETGPSGDAEHADDRRMARLHLRTGAINLARAELEALDGIRALDVDGQLDLAESRWRGGDLPGAGDAIVAYLEAGGDEALAYVIAAEASVAIGRVGDARRLARRALDRLDVPLDVVFAGQARSEVWPPATDAEMQPVSTLFTSLPPEAHRGGRIGLAADANWTAITGRPLEPALAAGQTDAWSSVTSGPVVDTLPLGLEDVAPAALEALVAADEEDLRQAEVGLDAEAAPGRADALDVTDEPADAPVAAPSFDAVGELEEATRAIAAGDHAAAAIRLGLILRAQPGLASVVLEVVGDVEGGPAFDLLRGDAHRSAGDEAAAQRAFATALRWVEDASIDGPATALVVEAPPAEPPTQLEALLEEEPAPDPNQITLFVAPADVAMGIAEDAAPDAAVTAPTDPAPTEAIGADPSPRRHRPGTSIRRPPTGRAPHPRPLDDRSHRGPRSDP